MNHHAFHPRFPAKIGTVPVANVPAPVHLATGNAAAPPPVGNASWILPTAIAIKKGQIPACEKLLKRFMAKRTDTNVAVLVQVMDELGFDQETIGKVTGVPLRTINDIANRRGYWGYTAECNELRELI